MGDQDAIGARPGWIEVAPSGKAFRGRYAFIARDADGEIVTKSDDFPSTMFRLRDSRREREMLRKLIAELTLLGWQAVPTGGKWYEHRLYYIGQGQVGVPAAEPSRNGRPTITVWGWSLVMVLMLLTLVVLLLLA